METQNKRRCEICNVDVNKSSYAKHLRNKMHEDYRRLFPANFFNESIHSETKTITRKHKIVTVPTLKELSMKKLLTIQKPSEVDSQIAQKMINAYYFNERFDFQFSIELESLIRTISIVKLQ